MQHAIGIHVAQFGRDTLKRTILGDVLGHDIAIHIVSHYP